MSASGKKDAIPKVEVRICPQRPGFVVPYVEEWATFPFPAEDPEIEGLCTSLKTPQLVSPTATFVENADGVVELCHILEIAFARGIESDLARRVAYKRVTGKLAPDPTGPFDPLDDETSKKIHALGMQLMDGTAAQPLAIVMIRDARISYPMLGAGAGPSIALLMSQQLVAAWTIFETLAGDLWEAAVNVHPHGLAQLAGRRKKSGQDSKPDQGKMVPFSLLELYDFDLRAIMGAMQRKMEKVAFISLEKIRGAYADAFGEVAPAICTVLADPGLDTLSAIRNLIVHKAGVCDQEYRDLADDNMRLPQLKQGEKLHLDGRLTSP